jgi:ABC-type glycerol-3-phosphate transport system permease component
MGSSLYDRLGGASAIAGQLTAIGTIVVAPMILVGLIVPKWLVTGLTLGAVTGE